MKKLILIFLLAFQIGNSQVIVDAYTPFGSAPPFNYYTLANAANPTPNEVNATTGLGTLTGFTASSVTTTPSPQNGSHSIKFTSTGTGSGTILFNLSGMTNGATYEIHIWINRGSGANYQLKLDDFRGWTTNVSGTLITASITADTWYEYVVTGTTSSTTPVIRITSTGASMAVGYWIAVDNITIYDTADL